MKKLFLCLAFFASVSFGCQKENTVHSSDEAIGMQLAQDSEFKELFKEFNTVFLKLRGVDNAMLEKLNNANNEQECNQIFKSLNIQNELQIISKKVEKLKLKYGNNLNETNLKMALKNNPGLINTRGFFDKEGSIKSNLRTAGLPCSDALTHQLEIIAISAIVTIAGCTAITSGFGAFGCMVAADALAAAAGALAVDNWESCMKDLYGHRE